MNTSKIIKGVVSNGRTIMCECIGAFPDMTPEPKEPEEVTEE